MLALSVVEYKSSSLPDDVIPYNYPFIFGSGSCRTSFHPLCAREASHRMEVWGKYGSDNVGGLFSSRIMLLLHFNYVS